MARSSAKKSQEVSEAEVVVDSQLDLVTSPEENTVTIDVVALEPFDKTQGPPLTDEEEVDLLHLERKVERSVFEAGKALKEIRDRRLYRSTHKTFELYCRERFGFNRISAYNKIVAAETFDILFTNGEQILPTNERQIRPIAQADFEPDQQIEAWKWAILEAGGKLPSGRIVKDVVQRIRERTPVPNPWRAGDIATIVVKENPELRGLGGCWAIVIEVHDFSCTVRAWSGDYQARIENLKELFLSDPAREELRALSERLLRLGEISEIDRSCKPILENLGKQLYLTDFEEKLLQLMEKEYLT